MTIEKYLAKTDDYELIQMCIGCYAWKKTGVVPLGKFDEVLRSNVVYTKQQIAEHIFAEALRRFKTITTLLLKEYPEEFQK